MREGGREGVLPAFGRSERVGVSEGFWKMGEGCVGVQGADMIEGGVFSGDDFGDGDGADNSY